MDKILALLDGSSYSESVCHHTAWIAKKLDASVELMHVLGHHEGAAPANLSGALGLGARSALLEELSTLDAQRAKLAQAKGRALLEDAAAILEEDGVTAVGQRLRRGDILDAVRDIKSEIRAITIGKRGEGSEFAEGHLGSNLERIVRSTKVPIFIASRAFKPISRVLIAYDGSASTRVSIERMSQSPVFEGLEISVLCVGADEAKALATAEEAASRLRAARLNASSRSAVGEPEEILDRLVADEGFDLLVMGAYGHGRIRNLIIGSTTTAMIQTAHIPVLIYR